MKRVFFLLSLPVMFLSQVICQTTSLPTQISVPSGPGNINDSGVNLNCNTYVRKFGVLLANLDEIGQTTNGFDYTLPEGYPPIAIKIQINDNVYWHQADSFRLVLDHYGVFSDKVFISSSVISYDYSADCLPLPTGEMFATLEVSTEIIGVVDFVIGDYPVCDYTSPGDIFDCNVFDATSNYCYSTNGCDNEVLTHSSHTYVFPCANLKDCVDKDNFVDPHPFEVGTDTVANDGNLSIRRLSAENFSTKVFPNPVNSELLIELMQSIHLTQLDIFDSNGHIVFSQKILPNNEEIINLRLSTELWANGVYHIRIAQGSKVQGKTILKM